MTDVQAIWLQGNQLFRNQQPFVTWQSSDICRCTAAQSEPRHFKYLCHAGVTYIHLKKYRSAIASLQTALDMEPRNSIAKVHLTQAQERLQQSRGEYTAEQLYSGRIKQTGGHSPVTPAPSLALNKPKVFLAAVKKDMWQFAGTIDRAG
ncbi:hypothetical protein WJX82_009956 [Trebouxia sp. C0006]